MKTTSVLKLGFCLAAAALLAAPPAHADQPGGKTKTPAAMTEQAMMEKYMKAATPGPEHMEMARLAGSWKLEVTSWPAPGAPPQKSGATAEFKAIMGGRYMQQEVHGDMMGQPFEGMGIEGFDNVSKERFGTWFDNMGSGMMATHGKCAAGAKTCTLKGSMNDPIAGKKVEVREVIAMTDDNKFTFAMYGPDPMGKEFKMMEILYTRQ